MKIPNWVYGTVVCWLLIGLFAALPWLIRLRIAIDTWVLNHLPYYGIVAMPGVILVIVCGGVYIYAERTK